MPRAVSSCCNHKPGRRRLPNPPRYIPLNFKYPRRNWSALGLAAILTFLAFQGNRTHGSDNDTMMTLLQQQPLFDLHLDTFGLRYHVAVNGSRVVHDLDLKPGQFAATFPVNHWMHPSDNSVTVNIMPPGEGEPINPRLSLSSLSSLSWTPKIIRPIRQNQLQSPPMRNKTHRQIHANSPQKPGITRINALLPLCLPLCPPSLPMRQRSLLR